MAGRRVTAHTHSRTTCTRVHRQPTSDAHTRAHVQVKCSGQMPCERCVTFCLVCAPAPRASVAGKQSADAVASSQQQEQGRGGKRRAEEEAGGEPYMDLALSMLDPRQLAQPMIQVSYEGGDGGGIVLGG